MARISASIICLNEEEKIEDCLKSVTWCDEIVVVDSGSTDRTVEIAKKYTDKVIHNPWPGYVEQVKFAMEKTSGEWIFCLDADERCTPELKEAIQGAVPEADGLAGFRVKRHVFYLGRWINHGGWYPDWKLRVIRRGRAQWEGSDPHYHLTPDGPTKKLDADLIHYTYRDFRDQIDTLNRFSDVMSEEWLKKNRRFGLLDALFHPPIKFLTCYVWKGGFLDGWPGFVIAIASAFHVFAKHVKLREKLAKK